MTTIRQRLRAEGWRGSGPADERGNRTAGCSLEPLATGASLGLGIAPNPFDAGTTIRFLQ
jgi:hypothetical protein